MLPVESGQKTLALLLGRSLLGRWSGLCCSSLIFGLHSADLHEARGGSSLLVDQE